MVEVVKEVEVSVEEMVVVAKGVVVVVVETEEEKVEVARGEVAREVATVVVMVVGD